MTEPNILFYDKHLVIAVKPQGVLSQPDLTGDEAMTDLLSKALQSSVLPVHRLDRAVGGVMVYARTRECAGKLSALVGGDGFGKEYLTVVDGVPAENSGMLTDFLFHDKRRNVTTVVRETEKDAKKAVLSYETVTVQDSTSLLRVKLHTGRTHQIRVQFSSRGLPILGDGKYGSRARHAIALWSYCLTFVHPITKKKLSFSALPPKETPWEAFYPLEF